VAGLEGLYSGLESDRSLPRPALGRRLARPSDWSPEEGEDRPTLKESIARPIRIAWLAAFDDRNLNRPRKETRMSKLSMCIAAATILGAAIGTSPVCAQDTGEHSVDKYTCKEIMRESGADRDAAIAFIHGYLVGKSGGATFNVESLEKQTDAFIDRCLDNPNEKALDVMMKVMG
jgi:hypothetical protein